ncbi:UNVERIFIED_CONTAM: hypothetical protein Slati_0781400 [Sesamum latifolium]|uniref:Uncharacterized protein n=1 Tax=Sesamum latifolium TaxID=2727402 RepID=A0AAW2XJQ1_9LAMI
MDLMLPHSQLGRPPRKFSTLPEFPRRTLAIQLNYAPDEHPTRLSGLSPTEAPHVAVFLITDAYAHRVLEAGRLSSRRPLIYHTALHPTFLLGQTQLIR